MNPRPRIAYCLMALLAAALLAPAALAAEAPGDLEALVNSLPDRDGGGKYTGPAPEFADKLVKAVLEGGKQSIVALVEMQRGLNHPEVGEDYKADYLLHAVCTHVRDPRGEPDQRAMVCQALAATLGGQRPTIVKAHVLEELKWVGGEESVAAIKPFLLDKELYDFAVQALVAIRAPEPMLEALPRATGRIRVALVQAMGTLGHEKAVPVLLRDVDSADRDLRLAAMTALAKLGAPQAVEPLLKAADVDSAYERSQVTEALLTLASRLAEKGERKPAERICRHLLQTRTAKGESYVRCGALIALAKALGAEAMDDVLAAMSSEDPAFRAAGFEAAIAMPGAQATQMWVDRMEGAPAARRVAILDLLAKRGDPAALPAILQAIKAPEEEVRLAAIKAAGPAGDQRAVPALVEALKSEDSAQVGAARRSLLRLPGEQASAAIAKAIGGAQPDVKAALLDILAGRDAGGQLDAILECTGDESPKVQAAAAAALGTLAEIGDLPKLTSLLVKTEEGRVRNAAEKALSGACDRLRDKNACVAAVAEGLDEAKGEARVALYRVLGTIGNRTAYQVVSDALDDRDSDVREAAIRGLAAWPDDSPARDLLRVAKSADDQKHHILALRGYIRMIGLPEKRPTDQALEMCGAAMKAARRPDEKRLVLGAIGAISDPKALDMAQAQLEDKSVVDEAALAAVKIAREISGAYRDKAKDAIQGAMLATDTEAVHKQAKEALAFIERFEDFITGWMIAGPYRGKSTKKAHPPEKPDAKGVEWKLVTAQGDPAGVVDLNAALKGGNNVTAYLKAQIWSPVAQKARLETGSDDGLKVWLNGKVVLEKDVARSLQVNEDKVPVQLQEGWNDLVLKVTQGGGDWAACARVRGPDGGKLEGLRFKAE